MSPSDTAHKVPSTSPTCRRLLNFSLHWKMCQTLMLWRQKSSCSPSGRFWQSLCHSFQWEAKMMAAESQWAISPLDIIYHHAFIHALNQTLALIQSILRKNTREQQAKRISLSLRLVGHLSPSAPTITTETGTAGGRQRWDVRGNVHSCVCQKWCTSISNKA